MAFCTKCGANVPGAFCSQCGTPVATAGAAAPPPMAAPYVQPAPYGQPVPVQGPRKTSPIVWVLVIVLGLFVLGGLATAAFVAFVAHRVHQAGVSFDRNGSGAVTFRGKDGVVEFGGADAKLPSWVPAYPGSKPKVAVRGSGHDGEGGMFSFNTSDSADRVKSFYMDKCKELGMKVNLDTTSEEGGMFVATEEGGDNRSLTVTVSGRSGDINVSVIYGRK